MQGHEIPPGYALVRLSDLATHAGQPPPDPGLRRQSGDAWCSGSSRAGMPILGLALGHGLASALGHAARWVGAGSLIATGAYGLIQALRAGQRGELLHPSPSFRTHKPAARISALVIG